MSLLPKSIKLGKSATYNKSSKRLSSAHDSVNAVIKSFKDTVVEFKNEQNKVIDTKNVAVLSFEFPSLETDFNTISFSLIFNNRTVNYVATEIALYNLTTNLPTPKSAIGKWILNDNPTGNATPVHDQDGKPIYKSLAEFSTFKLTRSTQKLYSILMENNVELDLDDIQSSLFGKNIIVKTYYNDVIKEYTICSESYEPQVSQATSDKPRAKKFNVRSRSTAGSTW